MSCSRFKCNQNTLPEWPISSCHSPPLLKSLPGLPAAHHFPIKVSDLQHPPPSRLIPLATHSSTCHPPVHSPAPQLGALTTARVPRGHCAPSSLLPLEGKEVEEREGYQKTHRASSPLLSSASNNSDTKAGNSRNGKRQEEGEGWRPDTASCQDKIPAFIAVGSPVLGPLFLRKRLLGRKWGTLGRHQI